MTDLRLRYDAPAQAWTEALPVGNGRLGAMVFGGVARERMQLNEDTLWSGGPYSPINPEALKHLQEVRDLLFSGRYKEAEAAANRWLMAKPIKQMPYQPAADLWIDMPAMAASDGYCRDLDLERAVASTRFTANGVSFRRDVFATAVDGVIAVGLAADRPGALNFEVRLTSPQTGRIHHPAANSLRFEGHNAAAYGIEGKLGFATELRVATDGEIQSGTDALAVRAATQATIKLGIRFHDWWRKGHSYLHPFGQPGEPIRGVSFHAYWLKARAAGYKPPLTDFWLNAVLSDKGRFTPPSTDPRTPQHKVGYAYHFDAGLYAAYLRGLAEKRGVTRVEGTIRDVGQDGDSGVVTHLDLGTFVFTREPYDPAAPVPGGHDQDGWRGRATAAS